MAQKHQVIEWLPWLPSKSCYTDLKFFETLKDNPNTSNGFRFVAFLVLEILGWVLFGPPPPLVLDVGTKPLGARRLKVIGIRPMAPVLNKGPLESI